MVRSLPKGLHQLSGKHAIVDKANTTVIISAAVAAAIVVFSLFAVKALIDKIGYQNSVISLRKEANLQLEKNVDAKNELLTSYSAFDGAAESVIGTPDKNSKIVLDALPSKYDFPAFATSLDSIITGAGLSVDSITGKDEEMTATQSSLNPIPIVIPYEFTAKGTYDSVQRLISDLQRSIRPFKIISLEFSIEDNGIISVKIIGESVYQPSKELGIDELVVGKDGELSQGQQPTTSEEGASQ